MFFNFAIRIKINFIKIDSLEKTSEYYESDELLDLDEIQHLRDN